LATQDLPVAICSHDHVVTLPLEGDLVTGFDIGSDTGHVSVIFGDHTPKKA
jgi:hypothetical protein